MAHYLIDFRGYYLPWSSILDAPVMKGMTEDDCLAHLTWRYGLTIPESIEILLAAQRGYPVLIRSSNDQRGISCLSETAEEYMQSNRAGVNEQTWTLDEIYDYYCVQGQIQVPEL